MKNENIMNINNINIFVDIVKTKSFAITGKNFGVSPTTVSRKLEHLEKEIGHKLIFNTTRIIELTTEGLILFNHLNKIVKNLNDEISIVSSILNKNPAKKQHGKLKIQLPMVLSIHSLSPFLPNFKLLYPDIDIEVIYSNEQPDMEQDKIDLAIINYPFKKYVHDFTYITCKLIKFVCTKSYEMKYGTPKSLKELAQHNLVLYLDNSYSKHELSIINLRIKNIYTNYEQFIEIVPFLITNNEFHNYQMMLKGDIICNILENNINKSQELIPVLPDYSMGDVKYYLVKGKSLQKQFIITTMADYIMKHLLNDINE